MTDEYRPEDSYYTPREFDVVERLSLRHTHGPWTIGSEYWEPPLLERRRPEGGG